MYLCWYLYNVAGNLDSCSEGIKALGSCHFNPLRSFSKRSSFPFYMRFEILISYEDHHIKQIIVATIWCASAGGIYVLTFLNLSGLSYV